jgi:hypothetical protein
MVAWLQPQLFTPRLCIDVLVPSQPVDHSLQVVLAEIVVLIEHGDLGIRLVPFTIYAA